MIEPNCIFCKIAAREIPVEPVYEDEDFIAFRDMHPQAPIHILLIPKIHYPTLNDVTDSKLLANALIAVQKITVQFGIVEEGYRLVLNTRDNGGQTVYHVHWHILAGRFMQWPPG